MILSRAMQNISFIILLYIIRYTTRHYRNCEPFALQYHGVAAGIRQVCDKCGVSATIVWSLIEEISM